MIVSFIFLGCTIASIVLSAVGIGRKSPTLLVGAALMASPLALYLGASPILRNVGFLLPLPQFVAALVVKSRSWLAIILVSPFVAVVLWWAVVVMRQRVHAAV